jgi:hypothetical protein
MARHTVANRFLITFIPPKCEISAKQRRPTTKYLKIVEIKPFKTNSKIN